MPPLTINPLRDLKAIVKTIPDLVTVQAYARGAGDTYGTAVAFKGRRQPLADGSTGSGLAVKRARWQLYAIDGQTMRPNRLGKIISGGKTWHITNVTLRFTDLIADCDCVEEV
jgi:hypothetical protein